VGLLPLGEHDKVIGRAPTSQIETIALRKDTNKSRAKPGEENEEIVEPHMVPEESIIRSLHEVENETFYLVV
jgi:hypothetical protein